MSTPAKADAATNEATMTDFPIGANNKYAHAIRKRIGSSTRLYTNIVNGETWVASHYWAAPVSNGFSALWETNPAPGAWVTGTNDKNPAVERIVGTQAPNLTTVVPKDYLNNLDELVDLERVDVEGVEVFVDSGGIPNPLYRSHKGGLMAFNASYLDLLSDHDARRIAGGEEMAPTRPRAVLRPLEIVTAGYKKTSSWILAGVIMPISLPGHK